LAGKSRRDQISRAQITVDDRGLIDIAGEDIAGHVAEHDERSHARGRVFKCGKLIGREISAASKFSSVSDKNRGGAAVILASRHRDPGRNLLRKNNDRQKDAPISVPSNAGRG